MLLLILELNSSLWNPSEFWIFYAVHLLLVIKLLYFLDELRIYLFCCPFLFKDGNLPVWLVKVEVTESKVNIIVRCLKNIFQPLLDCKLKV